MRLFRVQESAIGWHYQNVHNAEVAYNNSRESGWEFRSEHFNVQGIFVSYVYDGRYQWGGGVIVMLNGIRQPGLSDALRMGPANGHGLYFPVQVWEWVPGTRDAALVNLNAARAALLMAQQNYSSAHTVAMQAKAKADLVRDPRDQCSKTLTGCRLRFADTFTTNTGVLPASMFPGLQIG